jgi:hypothetical protein
VCFQLIYGDAEFTLPLEFEGNIEDRLYRILARDDPPEAAAHSRNILANRIVETITNMLEGEDLPPTDKQVKYAIAIARTLSLQIPAEVLQHRTSMAAFLTTYAQQY